MTRPWAEKYVGLPFKDGGRDMQGVDCWGLVRLVLQTECGIEVPSYGEINASELLKICHKIAEDAQREPWLPVINPQAFDVAVMRKRLGPSHVGIMFNRFNMLHVEAATSAVLINIKHPSVAFRSTNYFRHRGLLHAAVA